jgi:uncharacterized membrane protein (UPF0136 family)
MKVTVSLIAGVIVFLLLVPAGGIDPLPPVCWGVFGYEVPCDSRLSLAAGVASAAVVGLAFSLVGRRRKWGSSDG